MKSLIKKIINPLELIRAYQFHKNESNHIKASKDLELMLYSKIITNDMLHYGYFEDVDVDPETISIKDLENAQMKYVELIVEQILDKKNNVLDVGCGMGGLSKILFDRGMKVHSLTPDDNQKNILKNTILS